MGLRRAEGPSGQVPVDLVVQPFGDYEGRPACAVGRGTGPGRSCRGRLYGG